MKITIDLDALIPEAVAHMEADTDVRWSLGMALEEMYPEQIQQMQLRMVAAYKALEDSHEPV